MIVLTIVTFGVYHILWYFLRRPALNQLDSPRKLPLWPLCAHATALTLSVVADAVSFPEPRAETIGAGGALFLSVALLATSILMIVMSFRIKDMLEDHLAGPEEVASLLRFSQRVSLSGLMTFFFSIYYLQHVINRHVLTAEADRQLRAT